jgi:hypothetical protein
MRKISFLIVLVITAMPNVGVACERKTRECEADLRDLISARLTAIEYAFGDVFEQLAAHLHIRIAGNAPSEYAAQAAYDAELQTLIIPRAYVTAMRAPIPLDWASYYWPYYERIEYQDEFSVIGAIDTLLWDAYLQEAARKRGTSWPDKSCFSVEIRQRLPCEMLVAGIAAHVRAARLPMFNANRIDLIWPADFAAFERDVNTRDAQYIDVQRYGGILLLKPLIAEFGVPRVLAYAAGAPFVLHENNLRLSALRYQATARAALREPDHSATAQNREARPKENL